MSKVMEIIGLFMMMVGLSCADTVPTHEWLIMMLISLIGMGIFIVNYKLNEKGKDFE